MTTVTCTVWANNEVFATRTFKGEGEPERITMPIQIGPFGPRNIEVEVTIDRGE